MQKKYSRRNFLGLSGCAAMGYTSLFSSLINLKALNAAAMSNMPLMTTNGNYKALVCLYQMGGNDSFNMLVPKGNTEHSEYAEVRSNLAIPQEDVLGFNTPLSDGRLLGVHPSMPEVQQLYNQGKLAFVSNIGTLISPSTPQQFWDNQGTFPVGLFSHSDQIQQWQTAQLLDRSARGWGGKVADLIHDMNSNDRISMNISLSGSNVFQTGEFTSEFVVDPREGSVGIYGYENSEWDYFTAQTNGIDNMLDQEYADIFKKTYVDTIRNSLDANREFGAALEGAVTFATVFTDNDISKSFEMIAKIISTRDTLGFERQIFFVNFGGWDHHDELIQNQNAMLGVLSRALGQFNSVLEEMNMADCVTTFTVSEFARTLTSNGNGTDHAWGGNVMAMGGAVNGSNVFGHYPSLALNGPQNVGDGALMPTTSVDQYLAELALWFGVSPNDLPVLFPNLSNFYSVGSGEMPIGFLNL